MTDCFWCVFVGLCTNLEHLRRGQRSGPCTRRDGAQQRPAAGGSHGVLSGWRGGSASHPCAGAMQGIANGDGLPYQYSPVAQTGKSGSKRQGGGGRRSRCRRGRGPGRLWAWSGGLAAAQARWFHAVLPPARFWWSALWACMVAGGAAPCPVRYCLWLAAQRCRAGSAGTAADPCRAVQSLRCSAGRPLRSARTAGCSTARRGRSGCRSGPMRPWCRRPGAHGVRPRPGCGCRRWCGSAAASRMPGRCWPDR